MLPSYAGLFIGARDVIVLDQIDVTIALMSRAALLCAKGCCVGECTTLAPSVTAFAVYRLRTLLLAWCLSTFCVPLW
jgi:hypothetical protein